MASQITNLTIVYSTVYSDADQKQYQSSASQAFVWGIHRWPVNSPHKWPVTRKFFPFYDVIMNVPNASITDCTGCSCSHTQYISMHIKCFNYRGITYKNQHLYAQLIFISFNLTSVLHIFRLRWTFSWIEIFVVVHSNILNISCFYFTFMLKYTRININLTFAKVEFTQASYVYCRQAFQRTPGESVRLNQIAILKIRSDLFCPEAIDIHWIVTCYISLDRSSYKILYLNTTKKHMVSSKVSDIWPTQVMLILISLLTLCQIFVTLYLRPMFVEIRHYVWNID